MQIPALVVLAVAVVARLQAQPRWTVDPKPLIDIAATAANGDMVIGTPAWAARLADGGIVVADPGLPGIRFFDASGKLVRSVGRSGQGPGEFGAAQWVGVCSGGHIFAWDWRLQRLSEFDAQGAFIASNPVTGVEAPFTSSCSRTGLFAFIGIGNPIGARLTSLAGGVRVSEGKARVALTNSSGTATASLGDYTTGEVVTAGAQCGQRPLGRWTTIAVANDRVFVGTAEGPSIAVHDFSGVKIGAVALTIPPRSPTPKLLEAAVDDAISWAPPSMRPRMKEGCRTIPPPETLPAYRSVHAGADGLLWVVTTFSGDSTTELRSFASNGTASGILSIPVGLRVFEVGADYVLGAREDDDGEQRVMVFRFRRGR